MIVVRICAGVCGVVSADDLHRELLIALGRGPFRMYLKVLISIAFVVMDGVNFDIEVCVHLCGCVRVRVVVSADKFKWIAPQIAFSCGSLRMYRQVFLSMCRCMWVCARCAFGYAFLRTCTKVWSLQNYCVCAIFISFGWSGASYVNAAKLLHISLFFWQWCTDISSSFFFRAKRLPVEYV